MRENELRIGNWKDYKVYSDGRIRSKDDSRFLKQRINDKGYPCVSLHVNGKCVFKRVHRLVAEVFIPNPENKPCVNHKDRNRANADVDNLEWMTHSENVRHSVKNGGRENWTRNNTGENNGNSKINYDTAVAVRQLYHSEWSQNRLARAFNLTQSQISKIVNNEIWKKKN